jgi:hypothetical protein
VTQLTHNDTQDRLSDWGAAAVDPAPVTTITAPRNGAKLDHKRPFAARGVATDAGGVTGVSVSLRQRLKHGGCRWWDGRAWVAKACNVPIWVAARGTTQWSWTPPVTLKKTTGQVADYRLAARARDTAGALDPTLQQGRNASVFTVR